MKRKNKRILIAKILSIAYIIFISIFSLDSKSLTEFLIQLIPSVIFICILITAWKFPKIGGSLFIVAGLGTILFWNTYRDLFVFFTISIFPILIGILFLLKKSKNSFFFKLKR
jgi:hypothetical protein